MTVYINSKPTELPAEVKTISQLLKFLRIPEEGTGVGINNRLVKASDRDLTYLKDEDRLLIISATFGG